MNLISLLKLFLTLASTLTTYLHDKKMMDAGAAKSILEGLENAQNQITVANNARANADKLPESEDPNNRDINK